MSNGNGFFQLLFIYYANWQHHTHTKNGTMHQAYTDT